MRFRKSKRIDYIFDDPEHGHMDMESPDPQPLDALANQQLRKLLEEAIDKLPVDYRRVYVIRTIQQLGTLETAKLLDVTEDVVKTRYLRAKRTLKKVFEAHLERVDLEVFEFAGQRCDSIVHAVLARLPIK
jgi:RNA polymerase sigma-70 factor, ECF subfamily